MTRQNRYTGRTYREDPTIMAWEIANEPRGVDRPAAMRTFLAETARTLKHLDPNHLVTTGSEGSTRNPKEAGLDFELDHASDDIDYATLHIWVQNWGLYDPKGDPAQLTTATQWALAHLDDHVKRAQAMGKPLVLEEFGLARDGGSFDPAAKTTARDAYYQALFAAVAQQARDRRTAPRSELLGLVRRRTASRSRRDVETRRRLSRGPTPRRAGMVWRVRR